MEDGGGPWNNSIPLYQDAYLRGLGSRMGEDHLKLPSMPARAWTKQPHPTTYLAPKPLVADLSFAGTAVHHRGQTLVACRGSLLHGLALPLANERPTCILCSLISLRPPVPASHILHLPWQ